MILAYVDINEQNIIDFNSEFHTWKQNNTILYSANKWSDIYIQDGEYAILFNSDMSNLQSYDSNKVKDISSWDIFNNTDGLI